MNSISNVCVSVQIIVAGMAAIDITEGYPIASIQIVWVSVSLFLVMALVGILAGELIAHWMKIKRQLRSIYYRYIICTEEEQDVVLNVYDEAFEKSRVSNFKANPLYDMKI